MKNTNKTFQDISPSRAFRRTLGILRKAHDFRVKHVDQEKLFLSKQKQNAQAYRMPFACKCVTRALKQTLANTTCFVMGSGERCVLYFHGGCYADPPNHFHWRYLRRLAKSGAKVIVPIYNRTPQYTATDVITQVTVLYKELCKTVNPSNVVVMGDSAGGGLSLALCEHLVVENLPQPRKIILLSPWLDVDMQGDYGELEQSDVMLVKDELQFLGSCYRGQLPSKHSWCSPLFGVNNQLAPIYVYVGEGEMFFADCKQLQAFGNECGADVTLKSYPQMQHVFVVHPIPEAKFVQREIFQLAKD